MQKIIALIICFIISLGINAQTDSGFIKVHFLYGSKPRAAHRDTEKPWFGGLHGGHVSIEIDSAVIGFIPVKSVHVVSKNYNKHSKFVSEDLHGWADDTATLKYTTITIPVSKAQLDTIRKLHTAYLQNPPYDYAFIGMRCAAATYDILGHADIVKWKPNSVNTVKHFYPQLLRKKLLKLAKKKGYKVYRQPGRITRKWERD